uniref:ADP-ribosylation factor n=1 Tax=Trypanosoma congolense (strain IL3000) TaxID=1068625 RepID=G0UQB3_TRYCI|nr:conserved hypothetical protein [Trypanosoma congolense IL3000]
MSESLTIYVVGPTSSGKTTLLRQLISMSNDDVLLIDQAHPVPTKGQELHTLTVKSAENKGSFRTVELRELGGDMAPLWENFISMRLRSAGNNPHRFALMFVVDALSSHLLPLAYITFAKLRDDKGVCKDWPALILLNKVTGGNAMTRREADFFLPTVADDGVELLAVDSWNGVGLMDTLMWIRKFAFSP